MIRCGAMQFLFGLISAPVIAGVAWILILAILKKDEPEPPQ